MIGLNMYKKYQSQSLILCGDSFHYVTPHKGVVSLTLKSNVT